MIGIKRKYIWLLSSTIFLVISAGIVLLTKTRKAGSNSAEEAVKIASADAVPSDAVLLFRFKDAKSAAGILTDTSSVLFPFIGSGDPLSKIFDAFSEVEGCVAISVHGLSKSEIASLFSFELPLAEDQLKELKGRISSTFPSVQQRSYNNIKISSSQGIYYAFTSNRFIASTSSIILESSVRHLVSGNSILDNADLQKALRGMAGFDNILFVNHMQIGKLFSGMISNRFRKYVAFSSRIAGWSAFTGEFDSNESRFTGWAFNNGEYDNYTNSLRGVVGKEPSVMQILPYTTLFVISFTPEDFARFTDKYREYREFYIKEDIKSWERSKEWFLSLEPRELSAALLVSGERLYWITLVRVSREKTESSGVEEDHFKSGEIPKLFGEIFSHTEGEKVLKKGDWIITGHKRIIESFESGALLKLSLGDYTAGTLAGNSFSRSISPVNYFFNISVLPDTVSGIFREQYRLNVLSRVSKRGFESVTGSLSDPAGRAFSLCFFSDKSQRPSIPAEERSRADGMSPRPVKVPEGPFEVINHETGEKEYFEQLPGYMLRLTDKNHKGIWTIPFNTPLRGFTEQVDFFRNKKLQMLFASGNRVYLLDRNGRFVSPYPKKVDSLILLGPKCYDVKGDGDFAIMLLGTDNTLRLYDRGCKPYPAWSDITVNEVIRTFPALIQVGNNRYFVLRTDLRTLIYTVNGNEVTKLPGQEKIAPDSEIKVVSDREIIVKSTTKSYFSINIESGKTKRLKN
jgi:hypothetical protein